MKNYVVGYIDNVVYGGKGFPDQWCYLTRIECLSIDEVNKLPFHTDKSLHIERYDTEKEANERKKKLLETEKTMKKNIEKGVMKYMGKGLYDDGLNKKKIYIFND